MSMLHIAQAVFRLSDSRTLNLDRLAIQAGESWAFVGVNGSGKSSLARALSAELTPMSGSLVSQFQRPWRLSLEQLQQRAEDEWQRNNTDLLSVDEEDTGYFVSEVIQEEIKDEARCQRLAALFGIGHLLSRRFKYLSTGETRKTLLCQALMAQPDLLILDEPFDGLDIASRAGLAEVLHDLQHQGVTLVLVLNRFDEIPAFINQVGVLAECALIRTGRR